MARHVVPAAADQEVEVGTPARGQDMVGVERGPAPGRGAWRGCPIRPPPVQFLAVDEQVEAALGDVEADQVAGAHGVVNDSPLIAEHPDWFHGGSWGMSDYANPEFRRWWIELWTSYVRDFGIDGYRVDVSLIDPIIWDEITERCAALGKPIAVIPENGATTSTSRRPTARRSTPCSTGRSRASFTPTG